MKRVQLFYKDLSEIVGSKGNSVVRLTDADELRAISVICDKAMTEQLVIRCTNQPGHEYMLPEVLVSMLMADDYDNDLELMIYDVNDGQYQATLLNKRTLSLRSIRMGDAVLLHVISNIPLYIDEGLMRRQSSPYLPDVRGITIPINIVDIERLHIELERAIDAEDYRLASHLHEEILKRKKQ